MQRARACLPPKSVCRESTGACAKPNPWTLFLTSLYGTNVKGDRNLTWIQRAAAYYRTSRKAERIRNNPTRWAQKLGKSTCRAWSSHRHCDEMIAAQEHVEMGKRQQMSLVRRVMADMKRGKNHVEDDDFTGTMTEPQWRKLVESVGKHFLGIKHFVRWLKRRNIEVRVRPDPDTTIAAYFLPFVYDDDRFAEGGIYLNPNFDYASCAAPRNVRGGPRGACRAG